MECKKCGKINYATATVCTACGAPLEASPAASEPTIESRDVDREQYQSQRDEEEEENASAAAPPPANKKSKTPLIIGVIVLAVLLIGGLVWYLSSSKKLDITAGFRIENHSGDTLIVGESYIFTDTTRGAIEWLWDFGNGETSKEQFKDVLYALPGEYLIMLTVNGEFTVEKKVIVVEKPKGDAAVVLDIPEMKIDGIDKTYKVGDNIILTDNTSGAVSTTWTNVTLGEIAGVGKELKLKFDSKGKYKFTVTNSVYSNPFQFELNVIESENKPKQEPNSGGGGGEKKKEKTEAPFPGQKVTQSLNDLVKNVSSKNMERRKQTKYWDDQLKSILGKEKKSLGKYFIEVNGSSKESNDFGQALNKIGTESELTITKVLVDSDNPKFVNIYYTIK
jgi:PKD repeat protein/uncharacterized OB-fold protein